MAKLYDEDISEKFLGAKGNNWLGIVLPFDAQEEQLKGHGGFGYRRRVAIMGHHPSTEEIKDSNIVFALVQLGVTDGSGAANRDRKTAIAQGDVVVGYFLDGDSKQNPIITGVLGRTKGIKYGKGRFDIKSGYVGSNKKLPLTYTDEASGDDPSCFPLAINTTSKQDRVEATEQTEKSGVSTEPETDTLKEPPIDEETQKRIDEKVEEKVEEGLDEDEAKEEARDEVDDELREEARNTLSEEEKKEIAEFNKREEELQKTFNASPETDKEPDFETEREEWNEWNERESQRIKEDPDSSGLDITGGGTVSDSKSTTITSSFSELVRGGQGGSDKAQQAQATLDYRKRRRDLQQIYGYNSAEVKALEKERAAALLKPINTEKPINKLKTNTENRMIEIRNIENKTNNNIENKTNNNTENKTNNTENKTNNNTENRMIEGRNKINKTNKTTIGQSVAKNSQQQNQQYNNFINNEINKVKWKMNRRTTSDEDKKLYKQQIDTMEKDLNNVNTKYQNSLNRS